jgi:hypothetical protein
VRPGRAAEDAGAIRSESIDEAIAPRAQSKNPSLLGARPARNAGPVLAYQIGYLSNFIPVPGGIGVLDGSMIGMLVLYGLGGTVATAATLAYHAISLWVPAVWGTVAFIVLQRTKRQPIVLRNPTEELRRGAG